LGHKNAILQYSRADFENFKPFQMNSFQVGKIGKKSGILCYLGKKSGKIFYLCGIKIR